MKKVFRTVLVCAATASVVLVASCSKDKTASKKDQTMDSLVGKATITGTVYVDSDQTPKNNVWEVASGATVTVSIGDTALAYKVSKDAIKYDKVYTAKTDGNGAFSISVGANTQVNTYSVTVGEFKTAHTYRAGFIAGTTRDSLTTRQAIFTTSAKSVSLRKGESKDVRIELGFHHYVDNQKGGNNKE
jgi:hypothetical protein